MIKRVGLNFSLTIEDINIPSNAKRLGMTSTSMLDSLITYIFILAVLATFMILISFLLIIPSIR